MIFFLNKNTDFCWEKAKIFKTWGGCGAPKGEKADSVYPGYGRDPEDPVDTEDTTAIRRIQW